MGNKQPERKSLYLDPDDIKNNSGEEYPILFYEPNIQSQENFLKDLFQENSEIHFFSETNEVFQFNKSFNTSFILLTSVGFDEKKTFQSFQDFKHLYWRRMFEFEEESLLKDLLKEINDPRDIFKAYIFVTHQDFLTEAPVNDNEEEVMVMCDVKDMTEEFRQEFTILWYDPQKNSEVREILLKKVEIQEKDIYDDFAELSERISKESSLPYHLILTGKIEAESILDGMNDLKDLLGLYIYSDDPNLVQIKDDKVVVQSTLEELVPNIIEGIRTKSKLRNTFPAFATDFDPLDIHHLYQIHYYLEGLINFQNRKQAREDFLKLANKIYQDHNKDMLKFEQTYQEYQKEDILRWYTRDSPIYRLVNNCLRISSTDSILYCRFLLKDLERAIREEYQEKAKDFNGTVYRGAFISSGEWEKLQKNVGKEIEMYGFLSTTEKERTALNFVKGDPSNKIFITIIIPPLPELDEQGFADVSSFSAFKGEKEILFNVRSKFRILEAQISKIGDRGTKCRHLVLLYGAQLLKRSMTEYQPSIEVELKLSAEVKCDQCGSKENLLGFNKGKTQVSCFDCLRKTSVPRNTPIVALNSKKMKEGKIFVRRFKGRFLIFDQSVSFPYYGYDCHKCKKTGRRKYYRWISLKEQEMVAECSECFEKSFKVESDILISEEHPYMIWQESETGFEKFVRDTQTRASQMVKKRKQVDVFMDTANLKLCILYGEKMINKLKRKRWREKEKLEAFQILGKAYEQFGKTSQALEYFTTALDISKIIYGKNSLETIRSYNNLVPVYSTLKKYQDARECCKKALKITKAIGRKRHEEAAASYRNLATVYTALGKHQKALKAYKKALDILKVIHGDENINTTTLYENFASANANVGKYKQAIKYYQKALNLRIRIYGENHPLTNVAYLNLANLYRKIGNYKQEFYYHMKNIEKSLSLGSRTFSNPTLSSNYGPIVQLLECFGVKKQQAEVIVKALEVGKGFLQSLDLEKAVEIAKDMLGENQSNTIPQNNTIGRMFHSGRGNPNELDFLRKLLDLRTRAYQEINAGNSLDCNEFIPAIFELGRQGLDYVQRNLSMSEGIHGERHSHATTIRMSLESMPSALKDLEKGCLSLVDYLSRQ